MPFNNKGEWYLSQ